MGAKPIDTVLRRLGVAFACVCVAAAGLAAPARSAELVDVRVGVHPTFTRVVFELDTEAGYSVARPASGAASGELVVDLAAHSLRRVITSRSDLVETVRIEPGESGSVARILLRGDAIQVADMLLLHPPRIVIDLRPSPVVAKAEPSPSAPEEPSEPEPTAEEGAEAAPPSEETAAGGPPSGESEGAEVEDAETEGAAVGGESEEATAAATQTPAMDEHAQELGGGETGPGEAPPPVEETAREGATGEGQTPAPIAQETGRPVGAPGAEGTGPSAPFDDAGVLAAVAAGALLLVLLLVLRMRRSSARSRLPGFPPLEEEPDRSDEPVVEARAEDELATLAVPRAQELGGTGGAEPAPLSIFDTRYEAEADEETVVEEAPTAPALGRVLPIGAAPPRAAGSESERRVEELERRFVHLEKRLEEVVEVKDRLERQLATQNEELRVQRAAIARTQRVLRNLSRPEDAATEPAFKGPGSQPPEGVR